MFFTAFAAVQKPKEACERLRVEVRSYCNENADFFDIQQLGAILEASLKASYVSMHVAGLNEVGPKDVGGR